MFINRGLRRALVDLCSGPPVFQRKKSCRKILRMVKSGRAALK